MYCHNIIIFTGSMFTNKEVHDSIKNFYYNLTEVFDCYLNKYLFSFLNILHFSTTQQILKIVTI